MQKTRGIFVFFLVSLAVGSVAVSCATDPAVARVPGGPVEISVNCGPDEDGRVFTTEIFDSIRSVIIVDAEDKSKRIEAVPGEWEYRKESTELVFRKPLPFRDPIVHAEGTAVSPRSFILRAAAAGSDPLVVVKDRLAVEGFDYVRDGAKLSFRKDLDLEADGFFISYETDAGGASMGNRKSWENDTLAYLEAEHRGKRLKAWYASRSAFYFFEPPAVPGGKPSLAYRAPTAEERRRMEKEPTVVLKSRFDVSAEKLSKELGFPVDLPRSAAEAERWATTIEEFSADGRRNTRLNVMYRRKDRKPNDPDALVSLNLSAGAWNGEPADGDVYRSSADVIDLGFPVRRERIWAMRSSSMDCEPTVVLMSSFEWRKSGVFYSLSASAADDLYTETFIRALLEQQKR